jgi:erythromycin esterase
MRPLFVTVCLSFFYASSFSQDIQKHVAENTVLVSHIDPQSDEYADLEAIGNAIGDARVVMLGEQDHGDAPTFLAKTRLVKYLHEVKGFNVLAFESDFYGLTKGWDELLKQPDSVRLFLRQNIFPHWTRSDACRYLFEYYIPKSLQTTEPLRITGFDSQIFLNYSYRNLKMDLDEYLENEGLIEELFKDSDYQMFQAALDALISSPYTGQAVSNDLGETLELGLTKILEVQSEEGHSFYWSLVIQNLLALKNNVNEIRDAAMAENLRYLVNRKYKDEKIIVWAANGHIMKHTNQIKSKRRNLDTVIFDNMGTDFTKDSLLATQTYVIGFTSYGGTAGRLWTPSFAVEDPDENGLENWMPEHARFGFIDFKKYNQKFGTPSTPFLMKGPAHFTIPQRFIKIPWNKIYDGIFFIREMYAVKESG